MYVFPANRRAEQNSITKQLLKAVEEIGEAAQCFNKDMSVDDALDEVNDAICALEQVKRKIEDEYGASDFDSVMRVFDKGTERNDWIL